MSCDEFAAIIGIVNIVLVFTNLIIISKNLKLKRESESMLDATEKLNTEITEKLSSHSNPAQEGLFNTGFPRRYDCRYLIQRKENPISEWLTVSIGSSKGVLPDWLLCLSSYLGRDDLRKSELEELGISLKEGNYYVRLSKMLLAQLTRPKKIDVTDLLGDTDFYFCSDVIACLRSQDILGCEKDGQYYYHKSLLNMGNEFKINIEECWFNGSDYPELATFITEVRQAEYTDIGPCDVRILIGADAG